MPPSMTTPMSAEIRSRASSWRVVNLSWGDKHKMVPLVLVLLCRNVKAPCEDFFAVKD